MENKFNLIKGLWDDSHEEQKVCGMRRYAVMLLMLLTLGVGQMWATDYYLMKTNGTGKGSSLGKMTVSGSVASLEWTAASSPNGSKFYVATATTGNSGVDYLCGSTTFPEGNEIQLYLYGTSNYNDAITLSCSQTGTYRFEFNTSNNKFRCFYPKTLLKPGKYIYFDARNESNWKEAAFNARFYFKYYDSGGDVDNSTCSTPLDDYVYYAVVPANNYIGKVQMNRLNPSDNTYWNNSAVISANGRSATTQNCMVAPSSGWDNISLTWGTYAPPLSAVSLSDNGTDILAGGGTELNPYLIATGATIKVVASGTKAVPDPDATIWYDIKDNTTSKQNSSTAACSFTASATANTVYQMKVDGYTKVSSTSSTKLTSDIIYYKTVSVKNISVYIYVGDCTSDQINSLVLTGTPYVGSVALSGVTKYIGDFTTDGNWRKYTFTNVSEVRELVVARSGGRTIDNITATADVYYKYNGTALDGKCIPRANPTWGTAPANGAAGGTMTASVSGAPGDATISWSSTATSYATVTNAGVISYLAAGSATIKANVSWGASGDYCAGSYELSQAITVTSGATVSATRTCPEYVSTAARQVSMHITFTGTSSGWVYCIKHGWDAGYEVQWVDASGSSADWTKEGGVGTGEYSFIVELYDRAHGTLIASSSPVTVIGEISEFTNVVAGSNGSVSPSGQVWANTNHVHPTITATPDDHYHFVNWTSSNNTYTWVSDPSSASSTLYASASNYTITANFAGDQYSITYKDQGDVAFSGSHVDSPTAHPTTHTYGTATSLNSATKDGYTFGGWFTSPACTGVAVNSLGATAYTSNITLYAKWTEIMSDLSTSCSYDAGNPGYSVPSKSVSSIGIATTADVTATAPGTGYTLAGWTLTHCVRTDSNGETSRSITIRSDGSGSAATAQANYEEDLTTGWTICGGNIFGGTDWAQRLALTKKSGHSTESVGYYTVSISTTNADGGNANYNFKVQDPSDHWFGLHTDNCAWDWLYKRDYGTQTMINHSTNNDNVQICADIAGNYEIKVDYSTPASPTVTITFPTTYTLTYSIGDVNGTSGSISTSPSTASGSKVLEGSSITLTAPSEKSGYTWKGWYLNADGSGVQQCATKAYAVTMNADKTLYACYTEDKYTVAFNNGDHGTVSPSGDQQVGAGGKSITAYPSAGYMFSSWSKTGNDVSLSSTSTNPTTVTAAGTGSVTANYEQRFVLRGSKNTGGDPAGGMAGWGATNNDSYDSFSVAGNVITIEASLEASTEYKFKIWDKQLSAWRGQDGSSSMSDGDTWTFDDDDDVYFTTTFAGTYTFTIDVSTATAPSVTLTYPLAHTLTYSIGSVSGTTGNISTSPSTASGSLVEHNHTVTLTAPAAKTGYQWKGWYTNAAGTTGKIADVDRAITLTMDADKEVYACYEAKTYTVTLDHEGGSSGPSNPTVTFNAKPTDLASIPTKAGYGFDGYWTEDDGNGIQVIDGEGHWKNDVAYNTDASGNWIHDGDQKYYAKWLAVGYYVVGGPGLDNWVTDPAKLFSGSPLKLELALNKSSFEGNTPTLTALFKIRQVKAGASSTDVWFGKGANDGDVSFGKYNPTEEDLNTSGHNMQLQVYYNGTYTFKISNIDATPNLDLTVEVPVIDQLQFFEVCGESANDYYDWSGAPVANKVSKTVTLNNCRYKFKAVFDSEYYGKNETTITRASHSASDLSTSGADIYITPDVKGDYTFTYDVKEHSIDVTYPDKRQINYSAVTLDNGTGESSAPTATNDGDDDEAIANGGYVADGYSVTFHAAAANTGYVFRGWFSKNNPSNWSDGILASTANYTTTISANTTVFAVYGEDDLTVTVNATTGGSITTPAAPTATVTAHPATGTTIVAAKANQAWYFTGWTSNSDKVHFGDASALSTTVTTSENATVTANFEPRYALMGSLAEAEDPAGGMPSPTWSDESAADFVVKSFTAIDTDNGVDLECTRTLEPNKTYKFQVLDREIKTPGAYNEHTRLGLSSAAVLPTGESRELTVVNGSGDVRIQTVGRGDYTFKITKLSSDATSNRPTITVDRQESYVLNLGWGYSQDGGSSFTDGSVGGNVTATATESGTTVAIVNGQYVAAGGRIDLSAHAEVGYTFLGYYNGDGYNTRFSTDPNWYNENISAATNAYGKFQANTYTVTFDASTNGGTCATADKEVTFGSAYGSLPVATKGEDSFIGWYTTASGEGSLVTAETIVSTAGNHTLYARFETTYKVNVQFKCGSDVLYPQTSVDASQVSLSPTITAPEIFGYAFSGWIESGGSYVTFADASAASTTITTTGATTIVANYTVVPTVYFKNNLGWENVYVTFDAYFDGSRQNAPGSYGKPYFQMTQIGSSDIFYCEIPSTYTASNYASWANTIAFDNTGFDASANVGTKTGAFDSGEFIGRGDFDPRATMYIPYDGDTESRNGGTFYRTGCWIQYNTNYSGYKVKVNSKVQGGGGTETVAELRSDIAGSTEFTGTVNLTSANYTYGVMLYKDYLKNTSDIWYTNVNDEEHTITSETTSLPWAFIPCTDSWQRCRVHTESLGDYKFTVSFATGKPMVDIEYPVSTGDWKLIYKDEATWSNGAHTASWNHPSRVIKAKANAEDIVSFYVAYGSSPSIELYKCTDIDEETGAEEWTKQSDVSLTGITKKGIYNFKVSQDGEKVATVTYDGEYEGNFYIRTDASDGGWSNYKTSGTNVMTYSEYAEENSGFTHYYMRFANAGTNIKFCIANDYSECISDTLVNDTYTGEYIAAYGNVRFMWNKGTNVINRAYISGSSNISDRFLVLEGDDKMFDENGNALSISGLNANEMKFTDDQNWIYEATVKAQPGARIKLTAKYNNKIQYFYGAEGARSDETTELLLGGSDENLYKVRVVYDFKTNRLIKAFIPDGAIGTDLEIDADLMIIRDHQADAQQITFNVGGALSNVKTVYGAMMFNKYTVNDKLRTGGHGNADLSRYERDLFYISFPFDVKLSEVFGFGTYGKHWILEYYDGKGRAANGFWADSDPNWKFVMPSQRSSFTMKAFEGYILALDLDEMTESSEVWNNNVENVYLYFPSSVEVEEIEATNRLIPIDQDGYECTINRNTPQGDRRVIDSYWHCIGVPSFANYSRDLSPTEGGATIDWRSTSMPYLYEVDLHNNKTLSITSSATFSFKATFSYMVQYAGSTIYWSQVNVTPSSVVARERTAPTNTEFRIELQKNGQKDDQTFVRLSDDENVTTGFDFNYDLSKEFNKNRANIYTMVTTIMEDGPSITQTAGNVLPMSEQTTVVPVGVKIASTGDYTFAIPEGTNGVGVTLIDNETGIRTSLSALDYTINLPAGTYDNRFVLEISPIVQSPTGIESTEHRTQNTDVHKVLIDNILYIVKDGVMYDARGARVQ